MQSVAAVDKVLATMNAVAAGEDPAGSAAAALAIILAERTPLDTIDTALEAIEIGGLALMARDPAAARMVLAEYAPEPGDWLATVLASAGRAWLRLAAAEPDAAARAEADHQALVVRQAAEERPYLDGAKNPRRAGLLIMSAYFLSHAVRCVAKDDLAKAVDAADRAMRAADLAPQTPQAVGGQWIRVTAEALRQAPKPAPSATPAQPAP